MHFLKLRNLSAKRLGLATGVPCSNKIVATFRHPLIPARPGHALRWIGEGSQEIRCCGICCPSKAEVDKVLRGHVDRSKEYLLALVEKYDLVESLR